MVSHFFGLCWDIRYRVDFYSKFWASTPILRVIVVAKSEVKCSMKNGAQFVTFRFVTLIYRYSESIKEVLRFKIFGFSMDINVRKNISNNFFILVLI